MPKGKPWTLDEEATLKQLVQDGENVRSIAAKLGKTADAVFSKCRRLGLVEEGTSDLPSSTCAQIQLPAELPSSEEALKMLAGALDAATQPGLDRIEVLRLQVVATLARAYDHLLANYIHYREIETKLIELEHKYGQLAERITNNAPTSDNTQMAQPQTQ